MKSENDPIDVTSLVSKIREKVNDAEPVKRGQFVSGMADYLNISSNDLDSASKQIAPALKRANTQTLVDIASTVGINPSAYRLSGIDKKKNVIISDGARFASDGTEVPTGNDAFTTGVRNDFKDSLAIPSTQRDQRIDEVRKAQINEVNADTKAKVEGIAQKRLKGDTGSYQDYINNTDPGNPIMNLIQNIASGHITDGFGHKFLQNHFTPQEVAPPTPAQQALDSAHGVAERATAQGVHPDIVKAHIEESYRQQAIQELQNGGAPIVEENIQNAIEQLKAQRNK